MIGGGGGKATLPRIRVYSLSAAPAPNRPALAGSGAAPHGDGGAAATLGALDGTLGRPLTSGSRGSMGDAEGGAMPSAGAGSELPSDGVGRVGAPNDGAGKTSGAPLDGGGIRSARGGSSIGRGGSLGSPNEGGGIIAGADEAGRDTGDADGGVAERRWKSCVNSPPLCAGGMLGGGGNGPVD